VNGQSKRTIGITGGTGFVGKRFVQMAAERHYHIRCLTRDHKNTDNLNGTLEIVEGDITQPDDLENFVQGLDTLVHLAAHIGPGSSTDYDAVNVCGTRNICEAIVAFQPDCTLIHCSSIAVLRRYRTMSCFNTIYAASKTLAERQVRQYEAKRSLKVAYVYPGLVYGPGDNRFLPTLLEYIRNGRLINVTGGEHSAPLIYIDDLCDLILYTLSNPNSLGRGYIGVGDQEVGIHEFFRMLARRIDVKEPFVTIPKSLLMPIASLFEWGYRCLGIKEMPILSRRVVDILSISFSPEMVKEFNKSEWRAITSLEAGLDCTFEWMRASGKV
jgi:nucleoside-diphosphate-sugar epimerase